MKIDAKGIVGLDAAIKRLENLNLGGIRRRASSQLVGFKKQLVELTKEWDKLTAAELGGDYRFKN